VEIFEFIEETLDDNEPPVKPTTEGRRIDTARHGPDIDRRPPRVEMAGLLLVS